MDGLMQVRLKGWPKRQIVVLLFFFCNLICYMDRINISVVAPVLMEEFNWDPALMGVVLSSFFWGYTALQIPGGWLADRIGGKRVLGLGVAWWSLFTMLTPLGRTVPIMVTIRTMMGMGEGVNFPCIHSLISRWIPTRERSRVVVFCFSGMYVGMILALPLAVWIMTTVGWPFVFYIFGSLGFIWCLFWYTLSADQPDDHKSISQEELLYICSDRPDAPKVSVIPWKKILPQPAVWALIIVHFCNNWGFYIFLAWLPTYLVKVQGFSLKEMGLYSVLPYFAMIVFANSSGWLADYLLKKGVNRTFLRKSLQTISFVGAASFLLLLAKADSPILALAFITAALGLNSIGASAFGVNALDIAPKYAGIIMGLQNTSGNMAGVITPAVAGFIVAATGRWDLVFYLAAAIFLFGALIWNAFAKAEQILD